MNRRARSWSAARAAGTSSRGIGSRSTTSRAAAFAATAGSGFQISCDDPLRAAYGWQRDGGHAPYLVADERDLVHLPDSLSFRDGCFISCGVGTAYEAVLRGNVSGSDAVLVVGLGPGRHGGPDARKGPRGQKPHRRRCAAGPRRDGTQARAAGPWLRGGTGYARCHQRADEGRRFGGHRLLGQSARARAGAAGDAHLGPLRLHRRDRPGAVRRQRRSASPAAHDLWFMGHERPQHGPVLRGSRRLGPAPARHHHRQLSAGTGARGLCPHGGRPIRQGGHRVPATAVQDLDGSRIANEDLGLVAPTTGGSVWRFFAKRGGATCRSSANRAPGPGEPHCNPPVFRWCPSATAFATIASRSTDSIRLKPNMRWDRHHLHGDGWTGEWYAIQQAPGRRSVSASTTGSPTERPTPTRPNNASCSTDRTLTHDAVGRERGDVRDALRARLASLLPPHAAARC